MVSLAGEGVMLWDDIGRVFICVQVMLWDTSIMHGFEASAKYSLQVGVIDEWVESKNQQHFYHARL